MSADDEIDSLRDSARERVSAWADRFKRTERELTPDGYRLSEIVRGLRRAIQDERGVL